MDKYFIIALWSFSINVLTSLYSTFPSDETVKFMITETYVIQQILKYISDMLTNK